MYLTQIIALIHIKYGIDASEYENRGIGLRDYLNANFMRDRRYLILKRLFFLN
jgi:hypothetical protein